VFPGCVHLIFTACGLARQSSLTGAYIIGCYRTCFDRLLSSLLRDCSCTTHPALERLRSEREASAVCTQMCACLVTCSGDHYRAVLPLHYLHSRYPPPKRWSASWLVPRPRPRSRSTAWGGRPVPTVGTPEKAVLAGRVKRGQFRGSVASNHDSARSSLLEV
jgi:hypothetical protein